MSTGSRMARAARTGPQWLIVAIILLCLVLALAGCTTTPTATTVGVAIPVACQQSIPERPVYPTEWFRTKPSTDQWVQAAQAELERREGYETQLVTRLEACITPLKP